MFVHICHDKLWPNVLRTDCLKKTCKGLAVPLKLCKVRRNVRKFPTLLFCPESFKNYGPLNSYFSFLSCKCGCVFFIVSNLIQYTWGKSWFLMFSGTSWQRMSYRKKYKETANLRLKTV